MKEITGFIFFIYGLCIGSFLNVVIYRVPLEKNIAEGRSFCPKCKKKLTALELIPILSWLLQGRKCKGCKEHISFIYPLIELVVALIFLLGYVYFGLTVKTFIMIIFWSMLLVIAIIDLQTKYIFDSTLVATFVPIFILSFFTDYNIISQIISAVSSFIVYFLIYKIAYKYYGQEAFGFGDVLLIGVVGYVVDISLIFLTIFLPVYIAIFFYIIALVVNKVKKANVDMGRKFEMPFGPAIATSAFLLTAFQEQAQGFLLIFFG